jgi:lipopolysaccharide transport protein LptA|tara:strand:- start:366 stop:830 length:465 start_codon:yes stop_codon:yes gene_type:complete
VKKTLLSLINILPFLLLFFGLAVSSDVKKEIIRFSSETAHIKKRDGILHLSGEVRITYGQYVIKSDLLMAKTFSVDSSEVKIIEASKNIYFSNNKDITAKGDKLFMDVDKKFVSIEGNVEFSQGKSIIRAEKINVDLVTETIDFEGIKDSFIKN